MKMKQGSAFLLITLLTGLAFVVGCDWTTGGGVESWSERWNWVNFSGVYRGADGGLLISDHSTQRDRPDAENGPTETIRTVRGERVGTGNGVDTVFRGSLRNRPVAPGTVSISAAGFNLVDNGERGLVGGGKTGTIDYSTGAWSITLTPAAPDAGSSILASYDYITTQTPQQEDRGRSGTTQRPVYTFSVQQEGQRLQITDSNGAVYEGQLGSIRGSGGFRGDGEPPNGETIISQFEARGISAAGFEVKITGSFSAVVGFADEGRYMLTTRRLNGTWIESGGRTGDVRGESTDVRVTITTPETEVTDL